MWCMMARLVLLASCKGGAEQGDICIYGGTSAGVIAAYTASMEGKKVLLIEPGSHLGGMTSGGLGYTDIGNKFVVTGLARDFYRRIGAHYGQFEQWVFEPSVAEKIFRSISIGGMSRCCIPIDCTTLRRRGVAFRRLS